MTDNVARARHWLRMLLMTLLLMIPVWGFCELLGHPGWLSTLMLLPVLNIGLLYLLAAHPQEQPAPKRRQSAYPPSPPVPTTPQEPVTVELQAKVRPKAQPEVLTYYQLPPLRRTPQTRIALSRFSM